MVRVSRNLDSAFFQCLVPHSFLSFSVNFLFILSLDRCFANWWISPQNGHVFRRLKWIIILSMIEPSVLSICSDSLLSYLFISSSPSICQSKAQLQKTLSDHAGALALWHSLPQQAYGIMRAPRKEWPVPQLTGVYGMMGWHEILISLCYISEVFCPDQKRLKATGIFYLDNKENCPRRQWNTNWRHEKRNPDDWQVRCGYLWMLVKLNLCLFLAFPL